MNFWGTGIFNHTNWCIIRDYPEPPIPNDEAWKDRDLSSELIEAFKILDENSDGISARESMGEEIRKELMNFILRDVDCWGWGVSTSMTDFKILLWQFGA